MPNGFYENTTLSRTFNKDLVERAYLCAKEAHEGQKRKSGEEYIIHPVEVARILLGLGITDSSMICAALLHDVVEDTTVTIDEIKEKFGPDVAELVMGVTNLGKVDFSAYSTLDEAEQAKANLKNEHLRKLFLSMAEDVRVVIIKLADRLHNMQTIKALNKKDQVRISRETLNIFAPLALRLGMGEIKGELEDLAFPVAYPEEYKFLKKEANRRYKAADRYTIQVKRMISDQIGENGIKAEIQGRSKHIYSLYKKITRPEINWDFEKIYDLVALRIITDNVSDCYRILGIIHGLFRPIPNYIRDYIAAPKPNGYRSIHTSVFGPDGKVVEIQIRTAEMHEEAEFGVASHLHYTENKSTGKSDSETEKGFFAPKSQTEFLKRIKDWHESVKNTDDFIEGLKIEFLDDRIYVFSPMGDIYDLPVGSTPIDFAYEVHSRIGDTCRGAKVNGKIVPLDHKLKTRDVVEIIRAKNASPKRDWLDNVQTSKAKQHIRSYFRKFDYDKNREEGRKIVKDQMAIVGVDLGKMPEPEIKSALSETSFKTLDDLCASVGVGLTTPRQAFKILLRRPYLQPVEKKPTKAVKKPQRPDFKGLKLVIAPCCNPTPFDETVCYITRGRGLTVHKSDCSNLKSLEEDRLWEFNPWKKENLSVAIQIVAANRVGLIRDVSNVISENSVNIEKMRNFHPKGTTDTKLEITVNVEDLGDIVKLIKGISQIRDVQTVKKI